MDCVFIIFSTKGSVSEVDNGLKKSTVKSRVLDQPKPPQKFANPRPVFRPIWSCFMVLFISGATHGFKLPDEFGEHNMIKTEHNEDFTEHQTIDHLDNLINIKEPSEVISQHHIIETEHINDIDPLDRLIKNGKTLLETIYPDFDEKASTSQPNRLKRSIGTVDTSIAEVRTNEIAIRGNRCQNVFFFQVTK